ncbi:type II secretion system F family protein [Azohydromonas caseinilytica]|uniref:Type II secretion system F family protein n=1 Tax=Azohydromonas caseinilytica TaxID=2728836 RepID=A0A848F5H1_9BURK|nr:type II secretion system F family protein [Azohydromonas caseinilytica]NML15307.1 type II secretion system F family protein [Azohydromonas caseinilytica]
MDLSYLLFGVLLFVAVVLGLEGLYQVWNSRHSAEAKRLAARLRYLEGTPESPTSLEADRNAEQRWKWIETELLAPLALGQRLLGYVRSADTDRSAGELVLLSTLLGCLGVLPVLLLQWNGLQGAAAGVAGAALPWLWLSRRRTQRLRRLEQQLPLALDLIGRALRAGHALPTAIKMVGEETSDPIAREFRQLSEETNFGMGLPEALTRLAQRVPLDDVRFFVIAVLIQRETGGNLAELLDNIASIVRARLKLLGQVRTLSAEGRLSSWILSALPFVMAAALNVVNPEFMQVLWTDPTGRKLVGGALVAMALGMLWMRKIIRIRI